MTKLFIMKLITYYSVMHGFDHRLALSVAKVESNFNQKARGSKGEIGLFQIMPKNVKNPKDLKDIHFNIKTGISMLLETKERCKHKKQNDFTVCYNAGITGGSKIKYPRKFPYVLKVNKEYAKLVMER